MPFSLTAPPPHRLVRQLEQIERAAHEKDAARELADELRALRHAVTAAIAAGDVDELQIVQDYLDGIEGVFEDLPRP